MFGEELKSAELNCDAFEEMDSEDPLFILYTSSSTGKPKGMSKFNSRIYDIYRVFI